jgi:hypothetical protein
MSIIYVEVKEMAGKEKEKADVHCQVIVQKRETTTGEKLCVTFGWFKIYNEIIKRE